MTRIAETGRASAGSLLTERARFLLNERRAFLDHQNGGGDIDDAERAFNDNRDRHFLDDLNARLLGPDGASWTRLVSLFGLNAGEAAMLSVCVAQSLDPSLGPVIAAAQNSQNGFAPTQALVRRLFQLGPEPVLRSNNRLGFWRLVRQCAPLPGEPQGYVSDPVVADWLTGHLAIDADLTYHVWHHKPPSVLGRWPVDNIAAQTQAVLDQNCPVVVVVHGPAGSGRRDFAAAVADRLGYGAVAHSTLGSDFEKRLRLERFALFANAALIGPALEGWPGGLPPAPLHFAIFEHDLADIGIQVAHRVSVALPAPDGKDLRNEWRKSGASDDAWSDVLAFAQLKDVRDLARARPSDADETTRAFSGVCFSRLGDIGQAVRPQFRWTDLVLPDELVDQLKAFAFEARHRGTVLQDAETRRVFQSAAGLAAMFSGPPGVGKTMAAQIIAGDLGVPLLRVDLAAVSSKYVGETAKNLSAAFAEARNAAAVLFFDEADALFGKRTDVSDATGRYANADTGHLLQLLEDHAGIVVLSTNRRGAIEPAFIRRLRHIFEFPRPDARRRAEIWRKLLSALGEEMCDLDEVIEAMATSAEISPSQIKSAILTARYASLRETSPIDVRLLEQAVAAEYAKEGRTNAPSQRERSKR